MLLKHSKLDFELFKCSPRTLAMLFTSFSQSMSEDVKAVKNESTTSDQRLDYV